jgi:predicted GIY-YIG superfamily endonuclease
LLILLEVNRCAEARMFYTYMLHCSDGSFYVGQTDDLEHRLAQHIAGEGARYTRSRLPVVLVWSAEFEDRFDAKSAEAQIKRWSRAKKKALVDGDFGRLSWLASRRE